MPRYYVAMKIQEILISDLKEDPANARLHSERNIETIKTSLEKFGQVKPIIINKDDVIVAGNGTIQAARKLGWTKIKAIKTELDSELASAYAIADNRTGQLGRWDNQKLKKFFDPLKETNFDLGLATGFNRREIRKLCNGFEPKIIKHTCPECGHEFED